MAEDKRLDDNSRELLRDLEEVRTLERRRRLTARSTPEFHALTDDVAHQSRKIFEHATLDRALAAEDSPIAAEREEQVPGDWTRHQAN